MQTNYDSYFVKVLNMIIESMRPKIPPMPDDRIVDAWEEKQIKQWDDSLLDKDNLKMVEMFPKMEKGRRKSGKRI